MYAKRRAKWTPALHADKAIADLYGLLVKYRDTLQLDASDDELSEMFRSYIRDLKKDRKTDGDRLVREIKGPDEFRLVCSAVIAYAVQCERAARAGREAEAWTYAIDAQRWQDFALDMVLSQRFPASKHFAQQGASARHKKHREFKDLAMAHFEINKDRYASMTDAALDIVGNVVPMRPRTVLTWLAEHKKRR
jgi:hypothetical protein